MSKKVLPFLGIVLIGSIVFVAVRSRFVKQLGLSERKADDWLDYVVKKRDPDLCDKTPLYSAGDDVGYYSKETSVGLCKAMYGGRIGDLNYCNKLSRETTTGASEYHVCLKEYTDSASSLSDCEVMPETLYENNWDYKVREACYFTIANKLKNPSICDKITSSYTSKERCLNFTK